MIFQKEAARNAFKAFALPLSLPWPVHPTSPNRETPSGFRDSENLEEHHRKPGCDFPKTEREATIQTLPCLLFFFLKKVKEKKERKRRGDSPNSKQQGKEEKTKKKEKRRPP